MFDRVKRLRKVEKHYIHRFVRIHQLRYPLLCEKKIRKTGPSGYKAMLRVG